MERKGMAREPEEAPTGLNNGLFSGRSDQVRPVDRVLWVKRAALACSLFCTLLVLPLAAAPASAQSSPPVCFWSVQGPVCVPKVAVTGAAGAEPEALLTALLAGPSPQEQAQGLWSAIPPGTTLASLQIDPERVVTVRLRVPPEALRGLDPETFEVLVQQMALTLEPLNWRDLRIQTWDAVRESFVPLADFLPSLPAPRKETSLPPLAAPLLRGGGEVSPAYIGQPPAPGQGQPQGSLTGKTVYVSAGHGWLWNDAVNGWRTQRPPYPNPPYVGPIIEDHNNAEAVNQYLLAYLWNAGALAWPVRERDMNTTERIVNNDDPTGYFEAGTWFTSTTPGYDLDLPGQTYRWAATVTATATATAIWTATIPADGQYGVYVWYRPGSNRAPDARYTVYHAGGQTTVAVNQQRHGLTWRYIGAYGFRGGEVATVTLNNLSAFAGQAVIADAVRIGGGTFSSLTGIETDAPYPPNEPWWEVGAYYYTQRMGLNPQDWPSFNDVVARPMYSRWEHAGTGDDAVYISWHTNGYSGYQWDYSGTVSYVHNGEGKPVTPGSEALRHAIHTELIQDIRAGWDPGWVDRGERALNLGELRELWDDDPLVRMPGALLEIAYHDHPADTDALKEPNFERLVARAIYQGIVRYFEQRDGIDLALLPEPPTHLAVQNAGGGQVRISWHPSPTDTVGLVGDRATGYRVYTSTNGVGWSDGIGVATTVYTLTGFPEGQLLFVRVTATNAGGESFPTETLAVRVGDDPGVLLVNGFDRLNRTMLVPDYYPPTGQTHMRMSLERMNRYDYVIQHSQVISYAFDSASNEAVQAGRVSLARYRVVDWILGEESTQDETLNGTEQALLMAFLDSGGALFISGAEVGWDLDYLGSLSDRSFYNGYLRADYVEDDAGTYQVAPVTGSIFEGLSPFRFDATGMYDADYPDVISPANGSMAALAYVGGTGGTAAVQYTSGCQRLVHFGFPFETIDPPRRAEVMGRVMDFLDECLAVGPQTVITTPLDGGIYWPQNFPSFGGLASATRGVQRVDVSLRREADGLYWDGANWEATEWHQAAGTASWSFTMPVTLTAGTYTAQARAWDTDGISDTTPAQAGFRFVVLDRATFLPLVLRQYGQGVCTDILVNGGFEDDTGWEVLNTSYPAGYTTTPAHQGQRSMRVGIPAGLSGGGKTTWSSVAQTLTLPAGSTAMLSYWVYPIYQDADTGDWQYTWLLDGNGDVHYLYTARENLAAWVERTFDLSPFAAQTVSLRFSVRNDGDDSTAVTYIDDVRVEACSP